MPAPKELPWLLQQLRNSNPIQTIRQIQAKSKAEQDAIDAAVAANKKGA